MDQGNQLDVSTAGVLRGVLVAIHALTHLLIAKKLVTHAEYREAESWFATAFSRLSELAIAKDSLDATEEMSRLFAEIQRKLFEG